MQAAIRGARLAEIPGAGHMTPVEQPHEFSRVLSEFLESLP
jgi:pimeloyl-ACP methyl ester carboxylesterase